MIWEETNGFVSHNLAIISVTMNIDNRDRVLLSLEIDTKTTIIPFLILEPGLHSKLPIGGLIFPNQTIIIGVKPDHIPFIKVHASMNYIVLII